MRGEGFPRGDPVAIVRAGTPVLAHALAAALALVSAGAGARVTSGRKHAARPAPVQAAPAPEVAPGELKADNAARARRGLLPRKAKRKGPEKKRLVWRTKAPTWLGEPGMVEDFTPAQSGSPATGVKGPEEIADDGVVRATFEGASVEILLVRRSTGGGGPLIDATVEGAMVEAVLLRRRDSD